MSIEAFDRVHLDGTGIDRITEDEVVAVVRDALANGRGGRIITPNVDILRRAAEDPAVRRHLDDADLIVADGMPLVWASRLGGAPLPERVAGSSLIWSLSAGIGRDGRSVFVAGGAPARRPAPADMPPDGLAAAAEQPARDVIAADGEPADAPAAAAQPAKGVMTTCGEPAVAGQLAEVARGACGESAAVAGQPAVLTTCGEPAVAEQLAEVAGGACGEPAVAEVVGGACGEPAVAEAARGAGGEPVDGATRAAARLAAACPGLRIAGAFSPAYGFDEDETAYAEFCARVVDARPDLVFVGLGFPKQELVIERLRRELPTAWFVGCGAAVNFVAGDVHRAPRWMQRTGLEWAHRLGSEPRRLAGRYLRHDAPYALRLLARAPRRRRP